MAKYTSVLHQLLRHVPRDEFRAIVERHQGDKGVRKLSCWGQFVALFFGQLTGQHSLRDLITTLDAGTLVRYSIKLPLKLQFYYQSISTSFQTWNKCSIKSFISRCPCSESITIQSEPSRAAISVIVGDSRVPHTP